MHPSQEYRNNLRGFFHLGLISPEIVALFGDTPINNVVIDDLEAAIELQMSRSPRDIAPNGYRPARRKKK